MINFLGTLQNEWAGAMAFNQVDTLLAPYVRKDNLSYKEVKQGIQQFVYSINTTSRWGGQCVTEDTECLTPEGWKKYGELKEGDEIYVFDMNNWKIRTDVLQRVNMYDYNGDLLQFGKQLVTPNHFPCPCWWFPC